MANYPKPITLADLDPSLQTILGGIGETVGVSEIDYDTNGRLVSIQRPDRPAMGVTYDVAGRIATLARGTQVFTAQYDTDGRLVSLA